MIGMTPPGSWSDATERGWIIADFADVKLKDVDDGKWLQAGL